MNSLLFGKKSRYGEIVSNVRVYGLEESIVASGYPMNEVKLEEEEFEQSVYNVTLDNYFSKENKSVKRANSLGSTKQGEGHDNFLNGIIVHFDLAFTIKAWTEAQRYHFFDFVSSMSTMHKLTKFKLDSDAYEFEVDGRIIDIMNELQQEYKKNPTVENYLKLIYSNPVGMKLTARMTTNYRQLKTIYGQRKNHKLPEWREFCEWVLTLPNFKELTGLDVK